MIRDRLGWRVPPVQPGALWLHAASVGELAVVEALIPHLSGPLLVTTDSETGARAASALGVPSAVLPLDLPWCFAPLLAEARPRALVFVESAFWPVLAARARSLGVPVLRVSARESARTARLRDLAPDWFRADAVWARDAEAAQRLARRSGSAVVGGDLKVDRPVGPPTLRWPGPFAVGVSLRDGDVERLLPVVAAEGLRALLAPRYPERFEPAALAGRRWVYRSALVDGVVPDGVDHVVLDSVGGLARELAGAQWAFVGGTFDDRIGGHAPWDAARAGVSVVAGPEVRGQGDAFAQVHASSHADLAVAVARRRPPPALRGGAAAVAAGVLAAAGPPSPETAPRPMLWPLVPLVAGVAALRRRLARPQRFPVVVVSVGSTNARSPGRTSTVRALVGLLAGRRVGVATRGYRRARRGRDVRGSWDTQDAADLGDEGALLAAAGAEVAAGPDRVAAVAALVARGVEVVLLDDGLSVHGVVADLVLGVVDARFPGARGPLPAGERRELEAVPDRVDLVVVHHGDGRFAFPGHAATRSPGPWVSGSGATGGPAGPVAVWAAVGRGADVLASLDLEVARARLDPDHHVPDERSLRAFAGDLPLVCTAKDAVRLPASLRATAWWRDVEVALPDVVVARVLALPFEVRTTPRGSGSAGPAARGR